MVSLSILLSTMLVLQTPAPDDSPFAPGPMTTLPGELSVDLVVPAKPIVVGPEKSIAVVPEVVAPKPEPATPAKKGWLIGYASGLTISPEDPEAFPFDFRITGWVQNRWVGFIPTQPSWTDRAGIVRPIASRNYVEIERARLVGTGMIGTKDLTYYINLDARSDDNGGGTRLLDSYLSYRFDDAFRLSMGKFRVPAVREWQTAARDVQDLIDRSMATTLFRPDRSVGIWASGKIDTVSYHAMMSDGFNTVSIAPSGLDKRMTFSESMWWEPLGEYLLRTSDFAFHENVALRFGHSLAYNPVRPLNSALAPEATLLRLTDGSVLTDPGIFGRRTQVLGYDQYLAAIDAAIKYRGMHLAAEGFLRNIDNLQGIGRLPSSTLTESGYYVNAGIFLVPKRWQVSTRVSQAFGYRTSTQFGGAINWHPTATENLRITTGLDWLENNAASNTGANYRAGDSGFQLTLQVQAGF